MFGHIFDYIFVHIFDTFSSFLVGATFTFIYALLKWDGLVTEAASLMVLLRVRTVSTWLGETSNMPINKSTMLSAE